MTGARFAPRGSGGKVTPQRMKNARTALIANPIYDSVFKFLLDDNRAATVFLSALVGARDSGAELPPD